MICRVLTQHGAPIAPSTYYAAMSRPASAWAVRDARLKTEISRVWKDNHEVYGAEAPYRVAPRGRDQPCRHAAAHHDVRAAVRLYQRTDNVRDHQAPGQPVRLRSWQVELARSVNFRAHAGRTHAGKHAGTYPGHPGPSRVPPALLRGSRCIRPRAAEAGSRRGRLFPSFRREPL